VQKQDADATLVVKIVEWTETPRGRQLGRQDQQPPDDSCARGCTPFAMPFDETP
jgi:hypothetical protein